MTLEFINLKSVWTSTGQLTASFRSDMSQFMIETDAEMLPVGMLTVASRSRRQADDHDEKILSDSLVEEDEQSIETTENIETSEVTELPESTETTEQPESMEVIETTESITGLDEFAVPEQSESVLLEGPSSTFLLQYISRIESILYL